MKRKLVPLEPTIWMFQAALEALRRADDGLVPEGYEYHVAEVVYKAMLGAVPRNSKVRSEPATQEAK